MRINDRYTTEDTVNNLSLILLWVLIPIIPLRSPEYIPLHPVDIHGYYLALSPTLIPFFDDCPILVPLLRCVFFEVRKLYDIIPTKKKCLTLANGGWKIIVSIKIGAIFRVELLILLVLNVVNGNGGLLGLLFIVMDWIIPENSLRLAPVSNLSEAHCFTGLCFIP